MNWQGRTLCNYVTVIIDGALYGLEQAPVELIIIIIWENNNNNLLSGQQHGRAQLVYVKVQVHVGSLFLKA